MCGLVEGLVGGLVESFVARVFAGGKVTIPDHVGLLMNIEDGDYARITITETIKKKMRDRKTKSR